MDINVFGEKYNNIWFCHLPVLKGFWGDFIGIEMYSVCHNLSQKYKAISPSPNMLRHILFWLIIQPFFTDLC